MMQTPGSTGPAVRAVPTVPTVPRPTPLRGASAGPSPTLGGVAALDQYRASEKWRAEQRSELWEKMGYGEKVPFGASVLGPPTPVERGGSAMNPWRPITKDELGLLQTEEAGYSVSPDNRLPVYGHVQGGTDGVINFLHPPIKAPAAPVVVKKLPPFPGLGGALSLPGVELKQAPRAVRPNATSSGPAQQSGLRMEERLWGSRSPPPEDPEAEDRHAVAVGAQANADDATHEGRDEGARTTDGVVAAGRAGDR